MYCLTKRKKRNEELKQKHNGLKEDFQYNYQLLRERDDELDKLEKELEKKNQVIISLTKSIQNYKQQLQTEKNAKLKNQQLLNKSNQHIEIIKKEQEIKLNDMKFEYSQKIESIEKQNIQQMTQIQQLRELIERLKQQNQVNIFFVFDKTIIIKTPDAMKTKQNKDREEIESRFEQKI